MGLPGDGSYARIQVTWLLDQVPPIPGTCLIPSLFSSEYQQLEPLVVELVGGGDVCAQFEKKLTKLLINLSS